MLASVSSQKIKMIRNCLLRLLMYFIYQSVPPSKDLATQHNLGWVLQPTSGSAASSPPWSRRYCQSSLTNNAMLQVAGRNVILFVIFGSLEEMQSRPVVFFVFYLWSTIEVFRWAHPHSRVSRCSCLSWFRCHFLLPRYPFYMLACIGTEWKPLTWIRYSIWIPLYPLGVLAEGSFSPHERTDPSSSR